MKDLKQEIEKIIGGWKPDLRDKLLTLFSIEKKKYASKAIDDVIGENVKIKEGAEIISLDKDSKNYWDNTLKGKQRARKKELGL